MTYFMAGRRAPGGGKTCGPCQQDEGKDILVRIFTAFLALKSQSSR